MDARRWNPLLGLAIATSLSLAAQAQYYPSASMMMVPQQVAVLPQPMPMYGAAPYAMAPQAMMQQGAVTPGVMPQNISPNSMMPRGMTAQAAMNKGRFGGSASAAGWPAPSLPLESNTPKPAAQAANNGGRGQAVAESANFIVFANDAAWAKEVSETAERNRRDLAIHWLGQELPTWSYRCPIHVHDAPNLGASGETRFTVARSVASDWQMIVQGTRERILDSVLPHEISHTIFASYFGKLNKYVPRWADEGAATTVEHEAEKKKHRHYLKEFLQHGRGLAFNQMFELKDYPKDILPLYAQGHSAVQFLIDQSSPQEFVRFIELGMKSENWKAALNKHYAYESIWDFQDKWNKWLRDGSPKDLLAYAPVLAKRNNATVVAASANEAVVRPAVQSRPSDNSAVAANSNLGQVEPGRLSSDPRSLDLLPSHVPSNATTEIVTNSIASNVTPANSEIGKQRSGQAASSIAFDPNVGSSFVDGNAGNLKSQAASPGESFYQTQLRQASGQPATAIPPHNNFGGVSAGGMNGTNPAQIANAAPSNATSNPTGMVGLRPSGGTPSSGTQSNGNNPVGTSTARQQGTQSNTVQVLDWGNSSRFSGLRSDSQGILR